jgi:hypothetical protein
LSSPIDFELFDMESQDDLIKDFLTDQDEQFVINAELLKGSVWLEKNVVSAERIAFSYQFNDETDSLTIFSDSQTIVGIWKLSADMRFLMFTISDFTGSGQTFTYKIRFQAESLIIFENQAQLTKSMSQYLVLIPLNSDHSEVTLDELLEEHSDQIKQTPISWGLILIVVVIFLILMTLLFSIN